MRLHHYVLRLVGSSKIDIAFKHCPFNHFELRVTIVPNEIDFLAHVIIFGQFMDNRASATCLITDRVGIFAYFLEPHKIICGLGEGF